MNALLLRNFGPAFGSLAGDLGSADRTLSFHRPVLNIKRLRDTLAGVDCTSFSGCGEGRPGHGRSPFTRSRVIAQTGTNGFDLRPRQIGGKIATRADFLPQREHLSRVATAPIETASHERTISVPVWVRAAPQLPHSIFRLAPNRTKSAVVRMCFVDIHMHYAD